MLINIETGRDEDTVFIYLRANLINHNLAHELVRYPDQLRRSK